MKKKWLICATVLFGCSAIGYILFFKKHARVSHLCIKGSYFEPVKITEFLSEIPCVDVIIADKTTRVKMDLGFCGSISLPPEFLGEVDQKSFVGRTSYYGMRGRKYYSDIYELPKIKIGNMALFRAEAEEINPEFEKDAILLNREESPSAHHLGRIGWELFHNFNFFMDCENSIIAFCDSLKTLRKQGYPVDHFIETELLLDRNSIEFEVMTQAGLMRCVLDSGSTWNMLNKDIEGESNDHMTLTLDNIDQHVVLNPENTDQMVFDPEDVYEMPVFKVGNKDFGAVTFQKIKTPLEIDAIIGMEFLDSKLVFIDFSNRKIYFYEK